MALHADSSTMAVEAINEYLEVSAMCLNSAKPDGGCFGYPSALLLFCVTNALGVYLEGDSIRIDGNSQKISRGEPFRVLNHQIFGLNLTLKQIKLLEQHYRNTLAHNAIIELGAFLVHTPNHPPDSPFTFASNKVQVINVDSFHRFVTKAWKQFPIARIQTWAKQRRK